MTNLLVRLDGSVEEVLDRLVEAGFFRTKTEAVRAGILSLGREYQAVKSREDFLDELAVAKIQGLEEEIRQGKRKVLTESEVIKKYGLE